MAFHSSLSDREETSNSSMMTERERLETADTYMCPTIELSKAVSVSLGLDSLSSSLTNMNQCPSSAFTDCDPTGNGNSSRGAPELGTPGDMNSEGNRLVLAHTRPKQDDFGQVCPDIRQNSCVDVFRSGDMDGAQSMTRGSVISRFVCKDSSVFMSPVAELPATSRVTEVVPFSPYSAFSASSSLYGETRSAWCASERASGDRPQPHRGGFDRLNFFCKYCNSGQTSHGSRQECNCVWYSRGEEGCKGGVQAATAQAYGQVESYPDAVPQGKSAFSTIKIEPAVWVDCTDRSFR